MSSTKGSTENVYIYVLSSSRVFLKRGEITEGEIMEKKRKKF